MNLEESVYTAKTEKGWILCGAASSRPFEAITGLTSDASGAHLAYAAKNADAKWQMFLDGKPVGVPCDGIIAKSGIHVSELGTVTFTAKMGDQLIWTSLAFRGETPMVRDASPGGTPGTREIH